MNGPLTINRSGHMQALKKRLLFRFDVVFISLVIAGFVLSIKQDLSLKANNLHV